MERFKQFLEYLKGRIKGRIKLPLLLYFCAISLYFKYLKGRINCIHNVSFSKTMTSCDNYKCLKSASNLLVNCYKLITNKINLVNKLLTN